MEHRTAHLVEPPEQAGSLLDRPIGDEAADPRRGDGVPVRLTERDALDSEALMRAGCPEQVDITLTVTAEAEVLPHDDLDRTELADEHVGDEVVCRLTCPFGIEWDHRHHVHPEPLEQLEALLEVAQQERGVLRTDHFGRVAVEGGHHRGETLVTSFPDHATECALVPEVNTVVDADGHDGSCGRQGSIIGGQHAHHH